MCTCTSRSLSLSPSFSFSCLQARTTSAGNARTKAGLGAAVSILVGTATRGSSGRMFELPAHGTEKCLRNKINLLCTSYLIRFSQVFCRFPAASLHETAANINTKLQKWVACSSCALRGISIRAVDGQEEMLLLGQSLLSLV